MAKKKKKKKARKKSSKKKSKKKTKKKAKKKVKKKARPKRKTKKKTAKRTKRKSKRKKRAKSKKKGARKPVLKSPFTGREKRNHPRLPVCARVYWHDAEQKEEFFFTRDISASGLFLITDHPPPVQSKIELELAIQYLKEPLKFFGEVVRWEGEEGKATGCGVKFIQTSPSLMDLVDKLIPEFDALSS